AGSPSTSTLILNNGTVGSSTINVLNGNQKISAPVSLATNTTITVTNATDTLEMSGGIGGAGNMTLAGAGTLVLSTPANSYGPPSVPAGANLALQAGGTFGTGAVTNAGQIIFNDAGAVNVAAAITGAGTLTQAGAGVTTLSGNVAVTGPVNINTGSLA